MSLKVISSAKEIGTYGEENEALGYPRGPRRGWLSELDSRGAQTANRRQKQKDQGRKENETEGIGLVDKRVGTSGH